MLFDSIKFAVDSCPHAFVLQLVMVLPLEDPSLQQQNVLYCVTTNQLHIIIVSIIIASAVLLVSKEFL